MTRLATGLRQLSGWRRCAGALALGALGALALPPVHAVPLLIASLVGLLWLSVGAKPVRGAFFLGWWFGFGHFLVGVQWMANAFLTDVERFGWMIPFAVGGLAAVLAVFPALALAATAASRFRGAARVVLFAAAWVFFEWLRGWIFTGFPWALVAHAWAFSDAAMQVAALGGGWSLSFLTILAAAMPATLATAGAPAGTKARGAVACVLVSWAAIAVLWAGGAARLAGAEPPDVPGVTLRLVQAAIDPRQKAAADMREVDLERHLALTTDTPGFANVTHVVWPETAVRYLVERSPDLRRALGAAAPPGGALITGAPRAEPLDGDIERVWNSMVALDSAGRILATYDKFHLVPFGEYVPYGRFLPFLRKLTPGSMDFSAGPGPRTLRLPGLPPASPLICYEIVFPGRVVDRSDRPAWLLNLTNDAWFGTSSGPYQHFASARFRAVEEGLPLVRAANTGISAVVDAFGRVRGQIALGASGVLDSPLPGALPGLTPYARLGNWTLVILLTVAGGLAAILARARI